MAHAGGIFGKFCRQTGLSRCDKRPAINKDLCANLFGNRFPVGRNGSA